MSFTDNIDIIDLIINVLNGHEKKLDDLIERLNIITNLLEGHSDFKEPLLEYHGHIETMESSTSVLIVDDDEVLSETFKILLEEAGFIVDIAKTGNHAILKNSKSHYDLAILDLMLPDINGNELSKRLKDKNKKMSVILLTGHTEVLDDINTSNIQSDEVLLKPINPEDLLKITKKFSKQS